MRTFYVYILTTNDNHVLYIGVTNNITRRIYEHKHELVDGFTKEYHVHKLVYYEVTDTVEAAIEREKQLKHWSRAKKNELITRANPNWDELSSLA